MCLASLSSYPSDIILGGGYWIPMKREFKRDFRSMAKPTLQDNKHLLLPSNSLNKLCIGSFYFIGQTMRETLWRTDRDSNLFKVNLVTRVQSVGNPGNQGLNWFVFFCHWKGPNHRILKMPMIIRGPRQISWKMGLSRCKRWKVFSMKVLSMLASWQLMISLCWFRGRAINLRVWGCEADL